MALFDLKCPFCGAVFQAEEEWLGQTGECADCGHEITIRKTLSFTKPSQTGQKTVPDEIKPANSASPANQTSQSLLVAEMKEKVRDFFVEVTEDRITKFRHAKSRSTIRLEEIADKYSVLDMGIVYLMKNDVGSVFFTFTYSRDCENEISDTCFDLKMTMTLDGGKNIEMTESSGWESDFSTAENKHLVIEKIQLAIPLPAFADIAKASKIEYKIKTGSREIKGELSGQLLILKGFYNNIFDKGFELEFLYKAIEKL